MNGRLDGSLTVSERSAGPCFPSKHRISQKKHLCTTTSNTRIHHGPRKSTKEFGLWEEYARRRGIKAVKFPRYCQTRPTSSAECIKVLMISNLFVLIQYLERRKENEGGKLSKGSKVLQRLKDVDTLYLLFALHDILQIMNVLSFKFRTQGTLHHHIWSFVCKTKKQLKSLVGTDDCGSFCTLSKFMAQLTMKKKILV